MQGNGDRAAADLQEAYDIAFPDMKLHLVDLHLEKYRLTGNQNDLDQARELIEKTGYYRKKKLATDKHRLTLI